MIGRLGAAILLVTTTAAMAQTVTVRSGDHDGFARLVLEFPQGRPGWRLAREGRGYLLGLDSPDLRLDTGDVFRLIGRDRVESVAQDGPGDPLSIGLACDCHAEAFEYGASALVIDIRDGPAPAISPSDAGADPGGAVTSASSTSLPLPVPGPTVPGAVLPFSWETETGLAGRSPESVTNRDTKRSATATDILPAALPDGLARDAVAVEAIAGQLGRASSQGLVELPLASAPVREDAAGTGTSPNEAATPPDVGSNIRVVTEIDRSFGNLGPDRLVQQAEPDCVPDRLVSVQSWGDEHRLGHDLSSYRGGIVDAGDRPDPQAIRRLARHYVFLTFGTEARGLLDAFPDDSPDTKVLRTLADVMDDRAMRTDGPLAGQATCTSQVSLWAFLASPDPSAETPATAAIVTTFSGLPLHLRRHLAPRLAAAFDAADESEAAGAVLASVTRAPGHHGAAVVLAATVHDSGDAESRDALRPLLDADPADAAAAALTLLELDLADGGPVDPGLLEDAAAFAFELRDLPAGVDLSAARVRGLTANRQLREAFEDLASLSARGDAQDLVPELAALLLARAGDASDVDVLAIASGVGRLVPPGSLPAEARLPVAARLIDLGVFDLASGYLSPQDEADPRIRLARARHALSTGEASAALALASGLDADGAALLEAEALSSMGDHRAAADAFARLGDQTRSEAEALIARDRLPIESDETRAPLTLLGEAEDLRLGLEALLERQRP
jgi:hypothetical protein